MIPSQLRRILLKWFFQLAFAVALLLGVLGFAVRLVHEMLDWWPELPDWPRISSMLVWTFTLLLVVPILGVALAKLRVLVVVCVDMRDVPETDSLELAPARAGRFLLLGAMILGLAALASCLVMGIPPLMTVSIVLIHAGLTRISWHGLQKFYQQIGC